MSVDRNQRNEIANSLAAFLRGEISRKALRSRLDTEWHCHSQGILVVEWQGVEIHDSYVLSSLYWWGLPSLLVEPLSEQDWRQLCRHLAFLTSDLEEREFPSPTLGHEETCLYQTRLARWHVVVLALAFGLSFLVGWWLLLAAWVISFVLYQVSTHGLYAAEQEELKAKWDVIRAFAPFANEGEWRAHEGLLDRYRLPEYDPTIHGQRDSPTFVGRVLDAAGTALGWLIILFFHGFYYVLGLLLWPLWLVLWSLCMH
jgi:hypothetical protein